MEEINHLRVPKLIQHQGKEIFDKPKNKILTVARGRGKEWVAGINGAGKRQQWVDMEW